MQLVFSITFLWTLGSYSSSAFSPSSLLQSQQSSAAPLSTVVPSSSVLLEERHQITKLFSSPNEDDDDDDEEISDELSKLIGKRASLSKKSSPRPSSSELEDEEFIDPATASLYDGKSGMDIFDMPDFKTARPVRGAKEADDKARGGSGTSEGEGEEGGAGFYIDFQADYDDENDLHISNRIGFTTQAWGDKEQGFKAGNKLKKKEKKRGKYLAGDLQAAYDQLMDAGITFCDTSENYGLESRAKSLSAEHILCQCMDSNVESSSITASSMSNPWRSIKQGTGVRFGHSGVLKAIEGSAERLGTSAIDLYQVPANMFYIGAPNVVASSLCSAMDQGLINNIGVKNMYSKTKMKSFHKKLNKVGEYSLTSNQFEFSLVNRKAWKSGLIAACKSLGIIPIASNPLGDGLASGVWSATNPTGGEVSKKQPFEFKTLEKYSTLHDMLATVQGKVQKRLDKENTKLKDRRDRYNGPAINGDVSTTQIAINYIVAKGCVPMPSVKNPDEAEEVIGCLGWALTDEEVQMLDNAADMSDKGVVV